jgi:hypothetical protein
MVTWKTVVVFSVLGLFLIGLSALAIYQNSQVRNLNALLAARNVELQQANLDLGRAQTIIGDANSQIGKLNDKIKEEIKRREALLTLYAELEGRYNVEKNKVKIVTRILYKDREIPIPAGKIFVKAEDGTYSEVTSMKFNYTDFRITVEGDAIKQELSYKLHQKFRGLFVESQGPGGLINHYAELYEMDGDKDVGRVELTNFRVIKSAEAKNRMFWWAPHLDLSVGYGASGTSKHGFAGDIGFTTSGWGKTPDDLTWKFFRGAIGFMAADNFTLTFSPVQYNVGKNLPLLSNLWITPSFGGVFNAIQPSWLASLTLGVIF